MADAGLLAFSFGAGAAATLNPCGFALLPGYVAYCLARDEAAAHWIRGAFVGLQGGGAMTLGVLATFAAIGTVLSLASRALLHYFPWASIAVGITVIALGIAMLARRSFELALPVGGTLSPRVVPDSPARGLWALALFGAGFGIASLGCTLPIFLIVVTQAFAAEGPLEAFAVFLAYGLGMGAVLLALSLAVALGQRAIVKWLRGLLPHVRTIGALGLILAGGYLVYYQLSVGGMLFPG
jgi:cytochrome c biogenesis protein CcdA